MISEPAEPLIKGPKDKTTSIHGCVERLCPNYLWQLNRKGRGGLIIRSGLDVLLAGNEQKCLQEPIPPSPPEADI